jgi:hypothetical protein
MLRVYCSKHLIACGELTCRKRETLLREWRQF